MKTQLPVGHNRVLFGGDGGSPGTAAKVRDEEKPEVQGCSPLSAVGSGRVESLCALPQDTCPPRGDVTLRGDALEKTQTRSQRLRGQGGLSKAIRPSAAHSVVAGGRNWTGQGSAARTYAKAAVQDRFPSRLGYLVIYKVIKDSGKSSDRQIE